jgi:uncharacterized membrane protein
MKEFFPVAFLVLWFGFILFLADHARERGERMPSRPVHYAFGVIPVRFGNRRRTSPLAALIILVVIIVYALYRFSPHR